MNKQEEGSGSSRIKILEKTCTNYATEISRLEFKIGELNAEVGRLHAELGRRRSARHLAHELYRAVDDALIARIDKRGYAQKMPKIIRGPVIEEDIFSSNDKRALMAAAREYDIQAYFKLKSSKSGMKLRYRILSKTYRVTRDAGVFGLKKTYKIARRVVR